MNSFTSFLSEFLKRFGLESPKFFKVLAVIGYGCAFIGFIPDILNFLSITPNEVFSNYIKVLLKVAGLTTAFISHLTVNNAGAISETKAVKLPYTAEQKALGNDKSIGATIADVSIDKTSKQ